MELGEMVISTAGRDTNKYFVVIKNIDKNHIKIADGETRKIDNPKLKSIKHVRKTGYINDELSIWLNEGKRVRNEDLRSIINKYINKEGAE